MQYLRRILQWMQPLHHCVCVLKKILQSAHALFVGKLEVFTPSQPVQLHQGDCRYGYDMCIFICVHTVYDVRICLCMWRVNVTTDSDVLTSLLYKICRPVCFHCMSVCVCVCMYMAYIITSMLVCLLFMHGPKLTWKISACSLPLSCSRVLFLSGCPHFSSSTLMPEPNSCHFWPLATGRPVLFVLQDLFSWHLATSTQHLSWKNCTGFHFRMY